MCTPLFKTVGLLSLIMDFSNEISQTLITEGTISSKQLKETKNKLEQAQGLSNKL